MRRILLISFGIFMPYFLVAQARLGYTESEIKAAFPKEEFKSGFTEDYQPYIYFENQNIICFYYFNDEKTSFFCKIFPLYKSTLNYLVEKYNKEFVIISDTHWKYYTENGIIYVDLVFENGIAYFKFYI